MLNWISLAAGIAMCSLCLSVEAQNRDLFRECLIGALTQADVTTTVGELRTSCEQKEVQEQLNKSTAVIESSDAAVSKRLRGELAREEEAFVITPYYPNYLLFGAYNFSEPNVKPYQIAYDDTEYQLDDVEVKFQLSLKVPLAKGVLGDNGDVYAAYTNRSFWQAYNGDNSSAFRESNHQPELWMRLYSGLNVFGMHNVFNDIGIVHQSNGQGGNLSRSWNRLYARFVLEKGGLVFALQPWYRLKEDREHDNNPDIEDYLGNFEFTTAYKRNQHEFSLLFRNNLKSTHNRGSFQLDWSFPIHERLHGSLQWFNGYGESLIDYNHKVNSIGVGVKLTDWL